MNQGRFYILVIAMLFIFEKATPQSSGFGADLNTILEDSPEQQGKIEKKPQYDEEFKSGKISDDEKSEEEKIDQEVESAKKDEGGERLSEQDSSGEESLDSNKKEEASQGRKEVLMNGENQNSLEKMKNNTQQQEQEVNLEPEDLNFEVTPQEKEIGENQGSPDSLVSPNADENQVNNPSNNKDLQKNEQQAEEKIFTENSKEDSNLEETQAKEATEEEGLQEEGVYQNVETEQELPIESEMEPEDQTQTSQEYKPLQIAPLKKEKIYSKEQLEQISKETNVEVEDVDYISGATQKNQKDLLKSFNERRPEWSAKVELMYSQYEPLEYTSEIVPTTFSEYYNAADVPLSGFSVETKKNFSFGSVALGGGVSYYATSAALDDADLTLITPTAKATLYLDKLFKEPYVVPYFSGGYTYFMYEENYEDDSEIIEVSGETDNFFVSLGLEFQLDWLDPAADNASYETGLENTFFFLEGRMYLDQGIVRVEEDPDFSTDLYMALGLRLEF